MSVQNPLPSAKLPCGHTLKQHMRMEEAKASAEIEGAKTDKTVCEMIDMAEAEAAAATEDSYYERKRKSFSRGRALIKKCKREVLLNRKKIQKAAQKLSLYTAAPYCSCICHGEEMERGKTRLAECEHCAAPQSSVEEDKLYDWELVLEVLMRSGDVRLELDEKEAILGIMQSCRTLQSERDKAQEEARRYREGLRGLSEMHCSTRGCQCCLGFNAAACKALSPEA